MHRAIRPLGLVAAMLLGLAVVAGASAAGGPTIKKLNVQFEGSDPGPGYTVTVHARVRVCAKQGPLTLEVRERQTGFDKPPTVTAEHFRTLHRSQDKPCRLYTPSWKLRDEFFGAGIYKVRVHAVDREGERSPAASDRIVSGDE